MAKGSASIAIAKITRPRVPKILLRKRLFSLMDRHCAAHPAVWITGPAGSGKTTLVASYLDARTLPCIWYAMDAADSDIASFFYYLGLAVKKAAPRVKRPMPLLSPEYASGIPIFTRRYFEELFVRVKHSLVLVFDNYHHLPDDSPLHEIIQIGLSSLPDGVNAIVISRNEPPPMFAGLRANNRLDIVGWENLRLTLTESRGIARLESGKRLSEKTITRIHDQAGGWAAGLIMMAKRLRTAEDTPVVSSSLRHEEIFDYFATELFDNAEEEVRRFLLKTAVLPRITADVASKLTGIGHADRILAVLNRRNLFTEKRSGSELMYQYHPLFRHFLLSLAQVRLPASELRELRTAGAAHLEQTGRIEDAAEMYVAADNWIGLAGLVLKYAQELVAQGRSTTLGEWLAHIPHEMLERSPWLLYWMGIGRFFISYSEGRNYFERAFHLFDEQEDMLGALLAWSGAVDTIIYEFGDLKQLEKWVAWFNSFIEQKKPLPTPIAEYRAVSSMISALLLSGRSAREIKPWVERALRVVHECRDVNMRIQTSIFISLFYLWTGNLEKMSTLTQEQAQWYRDPMAGPMSRSMVSYSSSLYHWIAASPDYGIHAATEGLSTSAAHGVHSTDKHLVAMQLIGAINKGDHTAAAEYHCRLGSLEADTLQRHLIRYPYHHLAPWFALAAGDYATAYTKSQESLIMLEQTGGPPFPHVIVSSAAALALIYLGDCIAAKKHIAEIARIAEAMESPLIEFGGLLLEALHLLRAGTIDQSRQRERTAEEQGIMTLRRALTLGKTRKYMNTVMWHAPAMTELCIAALEHDIEVAYVQTLIRKRKLMPETPLLHIENWPWPYRIYTLGTFELARDGKVMKFAGKVPQKPLALLKALVSYGGKDVRAEKLTDLLWPDAEGDAALSSFSTTLQRLRSLLGNEKCIRVQDSRVSLDPNLCWVDAWTFDLLAEQVERAWMESDQRALRLTDMAVALYKGHFLDTDTGESWAVSYRERLKTRFLRIVIKKGKYFEQEKQWESAAGCFQRALDVDDLAEELYQHLMICHQQAGRIPEAISVYKRCCSVLTAAMNISPSLKTKALYDSLKR